MSKREGRGCVWYKTRKKKWKFDDLTKIRRRRWRRQQLSRDVHHLNPEINRKGSTKKSWVGKEVGTKTMWVPLVRGACIYGAHMARNITANNTTNTCAFPQHPPHREKKNSNKCHPTQSRGSETAQQTNKQSFGLRRESSTRKMSPASLFGRSFLLLLLPAISLVILLPCAWNVLCSFQSKCDFFFFFRVVRANVGSLAAWKKNKPHSTSTGYRGDRCRPSLQTLVIECYPAALKYAETIIIPPSVFNYGRRKGEGLVGERNCGGGENIKSY